MAIRTNKLQVSLEHDAIAARFDIFKVSFEGKGGLSYDSRAFESFGQPYILSLCGCPTRGRNSQSCFYLLAPAGAIDVRTLRDRYEQLYCGKLEGEDIESEQIGKHLLPHKVSSPQVDEQMLIQLLLNAVFAEEQRLGRPAGEAEQGCVLQNVTGHLYCLKLDDSLMKRSAKRGGVYQVEALELRVADPMLLGAHVRTFTRLNSFSRKDFEGKTPAKKLPHYVFDESGMTLRRVAPGERPNPDAVFVIKQFEGERNVMPFLNYKDLASFDSSKCGIIREVLGRFNDIYAGCAQLDFAEVDESSRLEAPSRLKGPGGRKGSYYKKDFFGNWFEGKPYFVVDAAGDAESGELCEWIAERLAQDDLLGWRPSIVGRPQTGAHNLVVIHDKEHYQSDDPYASLALEGAACQHFTVEGAKEVDERSLKTLLQKSLMESAIKEDVACGQMSVFKWEDLGVEGTLTFALPERQKDEACDEGGGEGARSADAPGNEVADGGAGEAALRFFFLTVDPKGFLSFAVGRPDAAPEEANEWDEKAQDLSLELDDEGDPEARGCLVEGFVLDGQGNVNLIKQTEGFPVPELDAVRNLVRRDVDWSLSKEKVLDALQLVREVAEEEEKDDAMKAALRAVHTKAYGLPEQDVSSKSLNGIVGKVADEVDGVSSRDLREQISRSLFGCGGVYLKTAITRDKETKEGPLEPLNKLQCFRAGDGSNDLLYWANPFGAPNATGPVKNAVIRRVHDLDGGEPFFADLLETLVVPIVRVNDSTVLPFPFKYLREWVEMQKLEERRAAGD